MTARAFHGIGVDDVFDDAALDNVPGPVDEDLFGQIKTARIVDRNAGRSVGAGATGASLRGFIRESYANARDIPDENAESRLVAPLKGVRIA